MLYAGKHSSLHQQCWRLGENRALRGIALAMYHAILQHFAEIKPLRTSQVYLSGKEAWYLLPACSYEKASECGGVDKASPKCFGWS